MKILLLSPLPPPAGGISTWTKNVLDFPVARMNGFDIYHQDTTPRLRSITRVDYFSRWYYGVREFKLIRSRLTRNIGRHNPDLIHLTSSASLALLKDHAIIMLANRSNIPVITHWRFGRIPGLAEKNNWEWKLLCRVIKRSIVSIVLDHPSYVSLREAGYENVVEIPNPVGQDIEKFVSSTGREAMSEKGTLLFAGHVIESKGVRELVKACLDLESVRSLILAGKYKARLKRRLMEYGSVKAGGRWLEIPGELERNELFGLMRRSEMLVLPSYTEGFPNVVLEAMIMGLPVVATNVGAIPDILAVHSMQPCGVCVPPGDIVKLREAIDSLLKDPKKARWMGRNGMQRVREKYVLEKVMQQYTDLWERVNTGIMVAE